MSELDAVYRERNQVVAALAKCFPSGLKKTAIEGWDEAWHNCVYIDLPTGQASWHFHDDDAPLFEGLPAYYGEWDGHSTPEKYDRLHALNRRATPKDASTQPVVVGYVSEAGLNALKDRGLVSIYRSKTKVCNVAVSVRAPCRRTRR